MARDQEAETFGRAQHLGDDDADDHQRAAQAQRGDDGREAGRERDVEDLLPTGRAVRAGRLAAPG